ncbi:unnamed protein product [Effrenium voratum]|nr:unnamed protein product [Effrenium voratum]
MWSHTVQLLGRAPPSTALGPARSLEGLKVRCERFTGQRLNCTVVLRSALPPDHRYFSAILAMMFACLAHSIDKLLDGGCVVLSWPATAHGRSSPGIGEAIQGGFTGGGGSCKDAYSTDPAWRRNTRIFYHGMQRSPAKPLEPEQTQPAGSAIHTTALALAKGDAVAIHWHSTAVAMACHDAEGDAQPRLRPQRIVQSMWSDSHSSHKCSRHLVYKLSSLTFCQRKACKAFFAQATQETALRRARCTHAAYACVMEQACALLQIGAYHIQATLYSHTALPQGDFSPHCLAQLLEHGRALDK